MVFGGLLSVLAASVAGSHGGTQAWRARVMINPSVCAGFISTPLQQSASLAVYSQALVAGWQAGRQAVSAACRGHHHAG